MLCTGQPRPAQAEIQTAGAGGGRDSVQSCGGAGVERIGLVWLPDLLEC